MPDETADALAALGYAYVPGNSGDKSDMVLRQATDTSKGFGGEGSKTTTRLTVVKWIRSRLTVLGGLEEVAGLEPATAYATPGWRGTRPFLLWFAGLRRVALQAFGAGASALTQAPRKVGSI